MQSSTGTFMLLVALLGVYAAAAEVSSNNASTSNFLTAPVASSDGSKIVGGTSVLITDFPYQLALQVNLYLYCGASLISTVWALTTANCAKNPVASMSLRAGSATLNTGGVVKPVIQKIVHNLFNPSTIDYDIALLKVGTPFVLGATIQPIKLHAVDATIFAPTPVTVSGWGQLYYGGCLPLQLQAVTIPIVNTNTCQAVWGTASMVITPRMVCAGALPTGGKGSCKGDGGGALVATINGVKTQVGIMSWMYACANPGVPDVFTRVANLRGWITANSGV